MSETQLSGEQKPVIGLILGDPAGIGPEIVLKSLVVSEIPDLCRPVLIGSYDLIKRPAKTWAPGALLERSDGGDLREPASAVFDVPAGDEPIEMGNVSEAAGNLAYRSIKRAFELLENGQLDAAVMAPINKAALHRAGFGYLSEFELLADLAGRFRHVRSFPNQASNTFEFRIVRSWGLESERSGDREIKGSRDRGSKGSGFGIQWE